MNLVKPCLLAAALLGVSSVASAATQTASFSVQLTVQNSCSISAGTAMTFATVTGNIGTAIPASTSLSVNCNNGAAYKIGLNNGGNVGTGGQRRMVGNPTGQFVNYNLYRDAGATSVWGAVTGTDVLTGTGSNTAQSITVYGEVPAGQSVGAGTYTDSVTATIEF